MLSNAWWKLKSTNVFSSCIENIKFDHGHFVLHLFKIFICCDPSCFCLAGAYHMHDKNYEATKIAQDVLKPSCVSNIKCNLYCTFHALWLLCSILLLFSRCLAHEWWKWWSNQNISRCMEGIMCVHDCLELHVLSCLLLCFASSSAQLMTMCAWHTHRHKHKHRQTPTHTIWIYIYIYVCVCVHI